MAEGVSHVQKLQHWKQKIEDTQGTSVEIKYKNQVVKWTVIEDVDPPISHGRLKDRTWAFKILTTTISHVMKYLLVCSSI
jgi:hypothetical protein